MSRTIRSRWARAGGVKTHYSEIGGNGPVLVALHGGGHGSSGYSAFAPLMGSMSDEAVRIIAPDSIGGYGLTDATAPTPHGLIDRVRHTSDFVDALCLERFSIVGNSQGAWAAAQYALENPDRVQNVILISSLTVAQGLGVEQASTPAFKALTGYDGTRDGMRRLLEAVVADHSKITDELIDRRQASAMRPGAMEAMDRFIKATASVRSNPVLSMKMDMRKSLPLLSKAIPTSYIWGEADVFSLPETGRKLEALLPDVKFHWIANAGHQVQTDAPEAVAAIMGSLLCG